MASYVATVHTPRPAAEVFDYMADLRNFARWDPSVTRSELVTGDRPGPDACYDVAVDVGPRTLRLRYRTEHHDPPRHVRVRAETRLLTSIDTITVTVREEGCEVTYDARLELAGPLRILDPLLERAFRRTADRAAQSLRRVLDTADAP